MVFTRGSAPSVIERNPPHDCPITATCSRSTLPLSGEPSRAFSFSAHAIALRRSSAFCCRCAAPDSGTLPITRKPCDAIVVKKPEYRALLMAQPPSPHAITGSLSLPGKLPRSCGRKTTWPGEPTAGSDMTLCGPGIAFGAPSSGSVVLTRSFLGPGAWANETHAARTNAVVSSDFMRRSLADGNMTALAAADCAPRRRRGWEFVVLVLFG